MAETDDSAFYKDTEHCTVNCNLLLACCHLENAVDWMGPCWSSYLQLMVCTVVRGAWEVWVSSEGVGVTGGKRHIPSSPQEFGTEGA
jgi:hypothetical protein